MHETTKMLDELSHDLEVMTILEPSFEDNPKIGQDLMELFIDIISFWARAVNFLRRNQNGSPPLPPTEV